MVSVFGGKGVCVTAVAAAAAAALEESGKDGEGRSKESNVQGVTRCAGLLDWGQVVRTDHDGRRIYCCCCGCNVDAPTL